MGKKINLSPLLIFGLFILIALFFYYPIFLGKIPFNGNLLVSFWFPWRERVPAKFVGVDDIREFIPIFNFTYESLKSGSIPFWNPYIFSGTPHLANWATGIFYPPYLAIFLLTKIQAIIFLKLIVPVLSGFFTYLYLRSLDLNKRSSFFGSVAFALSSIVLIWTAEFWQPAHSVIWLPLILFAVEKFIKLKNVKYLILISLGLALSIMAGYVQTTIYVYLMSFTYVIFRLNLLKLNFWQRFPWQKFLLICGAFLLSLGLSAVQTFPAVEFFSLSPRKEILLTAVNLDFLLPLRQILTLFVPDIFGHIATLNWFGGGPGQYYEKMVYVGVVPLILSSFAIFFKKFRGFVLFFGIWAILALSTVFDLPTSRLIYELQVPYLSTAIAIRIIFLVAFSFSVLSAFGLSWWLESDKKDKKKLVISLLPLIVIYIGVGGWLLRSYLQKTIIEGFPADWFNISIRNFILPGAVFTVTSIVLIIGGFLLKLKLKLKHYLYILIVLILVGHSFVFAQKYFDFSSSQLFYPSHPMISYLQENLGYSRFWGYGEAALENNFATVYKIYSAEGYDPVNLKRYSELLSAANEGEFKGIASRSDALIPNADILPTEDKQSYRLRLLDLLGVKLVGYYSADLKKLETFKSDRFVPIWQKDGFVIFENKKVFPRAFLVPEAVYADSSKEAIRQILDPQVDLRKKIILEEKVVPENSDGEKPQGKAEIARYSPNKVVIKTETNTSQFLVLTDSFYPAWQATIDNNPTKIYPADYALRGIVVPKGDHEIIFEYKSKMFMMGTLISTLSLLIAGTVLVVSKSKIK